MDEIKTLGFHYATISGTTIGLVDIKIPDSKTEILNEAEDQVGLVETQHRRGLLTGEERTQRIIDIWTSAKDKVTRDMWENLGHFNSVYMMANSGARGNISQLSQLSGMRGLVADPTGKTIEIPIRHNFREGLTVLEYFISTHGTRKGLADTALRTADSGYLTRRLVDVAQDVIVREHDCGVDHGIAVGAIKEISGDSEEIIEPLRERLVGRVPLADVVHPATGEVLAEAGRMIDEAMAKAIEDSGLEKVEIRSVLTCQTRHGVCSLCYGRNLATGSLVDVGEAVGTIAAQSIGEPGTQLTMRTFHTGGVAGDDITAGLPRVEELFEARKPKGQAVMTEVAGTVKLTETKKVRKAIVTTADGEEHSYTLPYGARLKVRDGSVVTAGDPLTEGPINPHDILRIKGPRDVQVYLVREVQEVYGSQGVDINDKHIEVIIRQMMRKVKVEDPGDTELLPGGLVDYFAFQEANAKALEQGLEPATAKPVLLGITKASLATESFLSAASFPRDHQGLDGSSDPGQERPSPGTKGKCNYWKANSGGYRYGSVSQH